MKQKKEYDMEMTSKAMIQLTLRVILAGYLVYLGWKILANTLAGPSPIPNWGGWLIFAAFGGAAIYFCVYAVKQFLAKRKAAELPDNKETEEKENDETDD